MEIFGLETKTITKKFSWISNLGRPQASNQAWNLLVVFGFALLVAVSVFCIVIFTQVQEGSFASADQKNDTTDTVTLNRTELNEAVSNLQKRRATFDLLRDRQPDIPNPSR